MKRSDDSVVIGCAAASRGILGPVVEVLAGRGNNVEVVSSVDRGDLGWRDAIKRVGPRAIYLICGDEQVTTGRIVQLRAVVAQSGVTADRIWSGTVNWDQPVQVLREAERLLHRTRGNMREVSQGKAVIPPPPPPPRVGDTHTASPRPQQPPPPANRPMPMKKLRIDPVAWANRRRPVVAGAGIGLLAILTLAIVWPSGDADASNEVVAASVAGLGTMNQALPEAIKAPEPIPEPEPEAAVEAVPTAEPAAKAEAPEVEIQVEEEDEPTPAAVVAHAPGSDGELRAIFDGLRDQRVRSLDILLLGPEARQKRRRGGTRPLRLRYQSAEAYCEKLLVDGIDGWRLPTAGELMSLSSSNMLVRTVFWSSTKGDSFGNRRVVFNVARKKMTPVRQRWRGARTICVRNYEPPT